MAFISEFLVLRHIKRITILIYRYSPTLKLPYPLHEFKLFLAPVLIRSYTDLDDNEAAYSK